MVYTIGGGSGSGAVSGCESPFSTTFEATTGIALGFELLIIAVFVKVTAERIGPVNASAETARKRNVKMSKMLRSTV
jgi:hypothetical protein